MRRRLVMLFSSALVALLVLAPAAMARGDQGEGWWGETDDKIVTNAGFIVIAAFPLFVLFMSLLQWRLEKRKEARKAASKNRLGAPEWRGGW